MVVVLVYHCIDTDAVFVEDIINGARDGFDGVIVGYLLGRILCEVGIEVALHIPDHIMPDIP